MPTLVRATHRFAAGLTRRRALELIGGAGVVLPFTGCGSTPTSPTATSAAVSTAAGTASASSACVASPSETIGPYPSLTRITRTDVRESRSGTPVTLTITVRSTTGGCAPIAGATVEIWQCDADGRYSEYTQQGYDGRQDTFLRGNQVTDTNGTVTFTTIYPGWYAGRATHIHVEVRQNGTAIKVTQIAFPEDVTAAVYAQGVYAAKGQNPTTNARDNVFSDGVSNQLASLSGSPISGFTATYTVGV